jgi:hypothetical protein
MRIASLALAAAAAFWLATPTFAGVAGPHARVQLAQLGHGADVSAARRTVRVVRRPVVRPVLRSVARPVHSRLQSYRR